MTTAAEYLRLARDELRESRAELDRQIRMIERTLRELERGMPMASSAKGGKTIRDIALDLAREQDVVTPSDVLAAAHEQGNDTKYESVSSILSRLSKDGVLVKAARGTYRLPLAEHNGDAPSVVVPHESPAGTSSVEATG